VAALVTHASEKAHSQHVVTLWTNVFDEWERRSSIQQRH